MFGYVKAYKPYMRIYEYEIYRSVYCSVCKRLSREYGFVTRLPLSYDIAFLGLMELSLKESRIKVCKERCPLHPIRKTVCLRADKDLDLTCAASVMLTYHKLRDDMADNGVLKKAAAMALLPFFKKANRQAEKRYPDLSDKISKAMKLQSEIERRKSDSLDEAAHPTALMMQAVFSELAADDEQREKLGRLGYLLGRFVYVCDALDDLDDDLRTGGYDPLIERFCKNGFDSEVKKQITAFCRDSIMLTLGALSEVYVDLHPMRYKDITDNIIYLGLKASFKRVSSGRKES